MPQFDERRIADRFDDVLVEDHVRKSLPVAKSGSDPRARLAKVKAFCTGLVQRELARLREHHLAHVDIAGQESSFAVSEIILPQPPESVVKSRRNQVWPRRAEIASPDRKRPGI